MIDPLSLFGAILAVVQMIVELASKVHDKRRQGKNLCSQLRGRVQVLPVILSNFPHAAANDMVTAHILGMLKCALDQACALIRKCQKRGGTYCCRKATKLDNISKTIDECIQHLQLQLSVLLFKVGRPQPGLPLPVHDWSSLQQHAASTSQPPYDQPPCVGRPSLVVYPALSYRCPTTPPGPGAYLVDRSAQSSSSARINHHLARAREESLTSLRIKEDATFKRAVEESLASVRPGPSTYLTGTADRSAPSSSSAPTVFAGSGHNIGQHSATSSGANRKCRDWNNEEADVKRVLEESRKSALANEEADLKRVLEESRKLALANEEATFIRAAEESRASARPRRQL